MRGVIIKNVKIIYLTIRPIYVCGTGHWFFNLTVVRKIVSSSISLGVTVKYISLCFLTTP